MGCEYFLILATVSLIISVLLSFAVSRYEKFSFNVFASLLLIQPSIGFVDILTTGIIVACVATFVPLLTVWRLRRIGLDTAWRDF